MCPVSFETTRLVSVVWPKWLGMSPIDARCAPDCELCVRRLGQFFANREIHAH
jgi:hypothetical protein